MIDLKTIEHGIRKESSAVLGGVLLFIAYYVLLILLVIGLLAGSYWLTAKFVLYITEVHDMSKMSLVVLGLIAVALVILWRFSIQVAWYIVMPLFMKKQTDDEAYREVKRGDCPELFSLIEDVANRTGKSMPKHVYLSSAENGVLENDAKSIWSTLFSTKDSLIIGINLLHRLNIGELKAVLGHEFGHCSQRAIRVSRITYWILLIFHNMMAIVLHEQYKALSSVDKGNSFSILFHLAFIVMATITRITNKLFLRIEKRNRVLSRYMEYEADATACRIFGAKAFISALSKLDCLTYRSLLFEGLVSRLLEEKRYLADYAAGFDLVESKEGEDEGVILSYDTMLESLNPEEQKFPSKMIETPDWDTHPSTANRINNAAQFMTDNATYQTDDTKDLVCAAIKTEVGLLHQQYLCKHMQEPVFWNDLEEMETDEFAGWLEDRLESGVPAFLKPFADKRFVPFDKPDEKELSKPIDSPFTQENRDLVIQFAVGEDDMNRLEKLANEGIVTELMYNGSECDLDKAIMDHKQYLDSFKPALAELELKSYIYLSQKTEDKDIFERVYKMLTFSASTLEQMSGILEMTDKIKREMRLFDEYKTDYYLEEETRMLLAAKLRHFLGSLDYKLINDILGNWTCADNETFSQNLTKCQDFASSEDCMDMPVDELLSLVDRVQEVLNYIYDAGKYNWTQLLVQSTPCQ